jgi:hypothetical protein
MRSILAFIATFLLGSAVGLGLLILLGQILGSAP